MAYEVGYPVDFTSGGDTVSQAFSKHINEITRIYGYLNELSANDLTAAEKNKLDTLDDTLGALGTTISSASSTGVKILIDNKVKILIKTVTVEDLSTGTLKTETFPSSFSSRCLFVSASFIGWGDWGNIGVIPQIQEWGRSYFKYYVKWLNGDTVTDAGKSQASAVLAYMAIGE